MTRLTNGLEQVVEEADGTVTLHMRLNDKLALDDEQAINQLATILDTDLAGSQRAAHRTRPSAGRGPGRRPRLHPSDWTPTGTGRRRGRARCSRGSSRTGSCPCWTTA